MIYRPDATGGISGPCQPEISYCAPPSEKCASKARVVPGNNVTGPIPLECILGPVPPQNTACAPPNVSKVSFQDEKHECPPRSSLSFAPKTFVLFRPSTLNSGARSEIPTIRFRRIPPRNMNVPPPERDLCPEKR